MRQPPKPLSLRNRFRRFVRRLLFLLLAIVALGAVIIGVLIYLYAQVDDTAPADVAIVLGAGTRNGQPSAVFRERINHAIDLYQQGVVHAIILTGGVGRAGQPADSEIARVFAIESGVPESDIYIETNSMATLENLEEAKRVMSEHGFATALVVSDPLHMYRAMHMAADLGMAAASSPTATTRINSAWSNFTFLVREIVLVTQYFFFSS